jgi:hypothetical protein
MKPQTKCYGMAVYPNAMTIGEGIGPDIIRQVADMVAQCLDESNTRVWVGYDFKGEGRLIFFCCWYPERGDPKVIGLLLSPDDLPQFKAEVGASFCAELERAMQRPDFWRTATPAEDVN